MTKNNEFLDEISERMPELIEEWKEKKEKDPELGEKFYKLMIFPHIIEKVRIQAEKDGILKGLENANGMIVIVGTTPDPLIIPILIFRPEKVFFLYTKETEHYLEQIVNYCNLSITAFFI